MFCMMIDFVFFYFLFQVYFWGTCKVRNEIKTERSETKRNQTKRNETDQNETKPIETKRNKIFPKQNVTKKNEKINMA